MSTIETDGFLSLKTQGFRERVRTRFSDLVDECEEVSRRATTQVICTEGSTVTTVPNVIAASLWARYLSGCQAAIVLAERGRGRRACAAALGV